MMKRVFAFALTLTLLCLVFAGCGKTNTDSESALFDRILYKNGLDRYLSLGDYKGITVDTASEEFTAVYDGLIADDASDNNFYSADPITQGTVRDGDIANIDYEGKKDGVAFDGGTAAGYDLTIGSGTFIPGFESGLIGKTIGSTVDLNLTFPEDYKSADLAGQAVIFTVKINSVKRAMEPEDFFQELGFESVDEYKKDVQSRAIDQFLLDTLVNNSEVKGYPESDLNLLYADRKSQMESALQQQYSIDFATYLQYVGKTESDFKKEVSDYLKTTMKVQMVEYAVFDKEKLSAKGVETAKEWGEESQAVEEAVTAFLAENAQIK